MSQPSEVQAAAERVRRYIDGREFLHSIYDKDQEWMDHSALESDLFTIARDWFRLKASYDEMVALDGAGIVAERADLAMLVTRLCRQLPNDNPVAEKARDYLRRKSLTPNLIDRGEPAEDRP